MVTPTTNSGKVDIDGLERLTAFLVENGVHGLVPLGSAGEFASFGREQRRTILRHVVETAGDTPVIGGCSGTSLEEIVQYSQDAYDVGVDASMVVTPYYLPSTSDGLTAFYTTLADRSPLSVVLYHIPSLTGQEFPPEVVGELATHENVIGIKDSSGDIYYHTDLLAQTPESFDVIQGITAIGPTSLRAGSSGLISALANVYPRVSRELYDAHISEDYEYVVRLHEEVIFPLVKAYAPMLTAGAIKHLLTLRGIDVGSPIPPLSPLSEAEKTTISDAMTAFETSYSAIGTESLDSVE